MVVKITQILFLAVGLMFLFVLPLDGLAIKHKRTEQTSKEQQKKPGLNHSPALRPFRSPHDGQSLSSPVAFTARYTSDWVLHEPGTTLQFPTVVYNTGNFDEATGVFTCPATGIYYFMVTAMLRELRDNTDQASVEIVSEGVVVGQAWLFDVGSAENAYVTSSTAAVVQCTAQGTVYVRSGETRSMIGGTSSIEGTQFMGYLITLL